MFFVHGRGSVFTVLVAHRGSQTSPLYAPIQPDCLHGVQSGLNLQSSAPKPRHSATTNIHAPITNPGL